MRRTVVAAGFEDFEVTWKKDVFDGPGSPATRSRTSAPKASVSEPTSPRSDRYRIDLTQSMSAACSAAPPGVSTTTGAPAAEIVEARAATGISPLPRLA